MGQLTHSPGVQGVESSVVLKANLLFVSRNPFYLRFKRMSYVVALSSQTITSLLC